MPGGFKDFTSEVLMSADVDDLLMRQTRMRFADVAERDSELTGVLEDGMFCITLDTHSIWEYRSSAWVAFRTPPVSYTPTWTNFVPGSASVDAWYQYNDGVLHDYGKIVCAADTTSDDTVFKDIANGEEFGTSKGWLGGTGIYDKPGNAVGCILGVFGTTQIAWLPPGGLYLTGAIPPGFEDGDTLTWDIWIIP